MIREQIMMRYDALPKMQKKVADFILENPTRAAVMTTTKLGAAIGVSDTTVIRLAYALGYEGFMQFQKRIREDMLAQPERIISEATIDTDHLNEYQRVLTEEIQLLSNMRSNLSNLEQLQVAARHIAAADRVMIFGYYGEHTVAYQLYFMLDALRPYVSYYRENSTGFREIAELNSHSAIISVLYHPYCPGTLELMEQVKKKDPYMITITDSAFSKGAQMSDCTIEIPIIGDAETHINSMTTVTAYINLLARAVKECSRDAVLRRVQTVQSQLVQPKTRYLHLKSY